MVSLKPPKTAKEAYSPGVRKLLGAIPGYDPFATEELEEYYFDAKAAAEAILFFQLYIVHIKGSKFANQPFRLEWWQKAIVANLVGWKRRSDGMRRFRYCFLFIPRKNGKTALAAGLALFFFFCDGEAGAEVYAAAGDRHQAAILFGIAKAMVERSEELEDAASIYTRVITLPALASSFQAISAEAGTKHGFNCHVAMIDELHVQPNAELVDVLETSQGARSQPLMMYLTTSDYDREGSVCNEKQDYAEQVRDGVIDDPEFLPVVYKGEEERWAEEDEWARANPNLGVSVSLEFLRRQYRKARAVPRFENEFKRLYLNIRTGQAVRWIPLELWDECIRGRDMLEGEMTQRALAEFLRGRVCYGGLDLSSTKDITAFVLAFPEGEDGYYLLPYFWIPEEAARERERADRVPYSKWIRQGWIDTTPGKSILYRQIFDHIRTICDEFQVEDVAYDPWQGEHLAQDLMECGLEAVKFRQGYYTMSPACKEFERLFIEARLAHGGNPVLRWMASNTAIDTDHIENIRPSKKRSSEKIDGIVAAIMAIGRAQASEGESVYASRGMIQI